MHQNLGPIRLTGSCHSLFTLPGLLSSLLMCAQVNLVIRLKEKWGEMLLCLASNLSSGLSLGSCAEHMKGKRAAGRVCCERVGGRELCCLFSLCSAACQGSISAHMCVYMHVNVCVPVCQHPELLLQPSTMSSRHHQR